MNNKYFKLITFVIIIVLITVIFLQHKKNKEYETYLSDEMQRQCKMLNRYVSLSYTLLIDFEKNNEALVENLKYIMYDTTRFLIYELQDITRVLDELSWMGKKLDILENKFYPDGLWKLENDFKRNYYNLIGQKINYDDLDRETKELLKEYKIRLKKYIDYKENKYGEDIEGFEFINQFDIKSNEWVIFINDVGDILF